MLRTAKVIFEDESIMVVDKKAGVVVNRSQTTKETTLQDDLLNYFRLRSDLYIGQGIGDRAGIVHRLDRETSGLILVAKTQKAFENLQAQFKNRQVEKEYVALVHGNVRADQGSIDVRIARMGKFGKFGLADRRLADGRQAVTDYLVEGRYSLDTRLDTRSHAVLGETLTKSRVNYLKKHAVDYTLLSVFPKTGRTHQIRVHLKSIGHPIVADLIYGPAKLIKFDLLWCPRLFLHASKLAFFHPKTKKQVKLSVNLPEELEKALRHLTINH